MSLERNDYYDIGGWLTSLDLGAVQSPEEENVAGTEILTSDLTATASGASTIDFASKAVPANTYIVVTTGVGAETNNVSLVSITVEYNLV